MTLKKIALRILLVGLAAVALAAALFFPSWKQASYNGGQHYAEPFRIAGNLYYVGANDIASFLITGPQGHVLIDGGYPGTPKLIMASIAKLGFDIKDVRVLLNSETHYDHAGGLAELQRLSGAKLWASEASADVIESGGDDKDVIFPLRFFVWSGITRYPSAHVDHRFKDGDSIRLGPIQVTARITPGHTRGCTSFSFPVSEGDRVLNVVSACSLIRMGGMSYESQTADFERSFRVLRSLPADVWVTSHARLFGRYRKFIARSNSQSTANPFIDPDGYRAYIDSAAAQFRRGVVH